MWLLGYPDRAAVMSRESVAIARGIVDSASDLVATLFWAAFFNLLKRDGVAPIGRPMKPAIWLVIMV